MAYIKCPRCDLNYIQEGIDICDICKTELKLIPDNTLGLDDYEESIICPVCKKNFMEIDEYMCSYCMLKKDDLFVPDVLDEIDSESETWREFLDDEKPIEIDDEEMKILSLTELEDEEEEPVDEYEEEAFAEEEGEDFDDIADVLDFDEEDEDTNDEEAEDE